MKRLTERFSNGQAAVLGCGSNCKHDYSYCHNHYEDCPTINAIYEKLAIYEDLEEQGLLFKFPCKAGDTLYCWRKVVPTKYSDYGCEKWLQTENKIIPARVVSIRVTKSGVFIKVALKGKCLVKRMWNDEVTTSDNYEYCFYSLRAGCIGRTVFLTEEEALKKLESEDKSDE